MKFRAHETFFFRKGWLSKGMKYVRLKPNVFVDKNDNPMDVLGLGSNMVKSLRYWLQAVGLTEETKSGKRKQFLTELGEIIYKNDRYIEELGTLYLLHYKLVTNYDNATSWYFFFNEFLMTEFTKDDFIAMLQNYISMKNDKADIAIRSLNDDFICIINTYLEKNISGSKKISPENNIECPLAELGFIDYLSKEKNIYKKKCPTAASFNPWIILAVLMDQSNGRKEIGLNELLHSKCNIGCVFNLDSITMLEVLHKVENIGAIKIVRTAGLDVIKIEEQYTFIECVKKYYDSINDY